jgi:hypothetical protein
LFIFVVLVWGYCGLFLCVCETGSDYLAQAGLKLVTVNPPASAS